jgi:RNA polymerase sigma-70 factor (ECF subfamily)
MTQIGGGAVNVADDAGFEAMYRREVRSIVTLCTVLSGSAETGADLAHEAMLRAYRDWDHVAQMERPGAWVRRVAINLATDAHRRRRSERRGIERLSAQRPSDAVDLVALDFWPAVRMLPPRQQAVVALHYVDDMAVADIAAVLAVSTGTVKTQLHRGRVALSRLLRIEEVAP